MIQNKPLDQDLESIANALASYHRERMEHFQQRRDFKRIVRDGFTDGRFSLTRLLRGLEADDPKRVSPHEWSESEQIAEKIGRQPHPGCAFLPTIEQRDLTAAVGGAGGYLAATETGPGDLFLQFLHAASVTSALGVETIPLRGDASVPRIGTAFSSYWLADESTAITESTFDLAVAAGTPKHVGSYAEISRQLLLQSSPVAYRFILQALARSVAAALDAALLNGSGASGQPTGILNTTGIGSVSGASLAWAGIVDALKACEDANAFVNPDRIAWTCPSDVAEILRERDKGTDTAQFLMTDDTIGGRRALVSNSCPAATALVGDWSQVALLSWSPVEIGVDPVGVSSALFKKNMVGLRAIVSVDVLVKQVSSFTKIVSIT